MASANTLCKKLLNVNTAVVTGHEFYQDSDGVNHIRIKARPNGIMRMTVRSVINDANVMIPRAAFHAYGEDLTGEEPHIGIDETSYKKGHKYITVIVNHDTNTVVWAAQGHGKAVLESFYRQLSKEQLATIKVVTGDGARWITDCVLHLCWGASVGRLKSG